jgi:hypothetical protein
MRPFIFVVFLGGVAMAKTTIDVDVPEGMNAFPIVDEHAPNDRPIGEMRGWRFHSNLQTLLGLMLDRLLPPGHDYRVSLSLPKLVYYSDDIKSPGYVSRVVLQYKFTVTRDGAPWISSSETLTGAIDTWHRRYARTVAKLDPGYTPIPLYETVFGLLDELARSLTSPVAKHRVE